MANIHGPLSLDGVSLEESNRLIGEAIAQHQASIAALKSQKNGLLAISRLPPEILCCIFLFAKSGLNLDKWIGMTYVSSHWRQVAIHSPNLWTELPIEKLQWVKVMLERSKDARLVINVDLSKASRLDALKLALKHSSRIQHLAIRNVYDLALWKDLQRVLPKSAPQLESLCVSRNEGGWLSLVPSDQEDNLLAISDEIFCHTERLRRLELQMCTPKWDSMHRFLLRSLTHLKLKSIPLASRPTGKQFIDALREMPDLQSLDLVDALPPEQISGSSDHIHLSLLQTLLVCSTATELNHFFRCVTFSPTAHVEINCSIEERPMTVGSSLGCITALSRSYSENPLHTPFQTLMFPGSPFPPFRIQLFKESLSEAEMMSPTALSPQFQLSFTWDIPPPLHSFDTLLLDGIFSGGLPLQDVTRIYLARAAGILPEPKTIADTLGKLPHVESITVHNHAGNAFFQALQLDSTHDVSASPKQTQNFTFPSLSSICFHGTKFWKPMVPDNLNLSLESTPPSNAIPIAALRNCLNERSKGGAQIKYLTLKLCRELRKTDVDSLANTVSSIAWDSLEAFGPSPSEELSDYSCSEAGDGELDAYSDYYDDDEIYSDDPDEEYAHYLDAGHIGW